MKHDPPTTRIVFNADDFGRCAAVNAAVERAHRQGVLTSASLMVGGAAAAEAVAIARRNPDLAVGLHVVVCDGRPVLRSEQIPALVGADGRFEPSPLRAGLRYAVNSTARRQLGSELRAQFQVFSDTGLVLAHVDGHAHMHMHPTVFDLLTPLIERYRPGAFRLVKDPLLAALRHDHRLTATRLAWSAAFALLRRRCRRRLPPDVVVADHTFGLMRSGAMSETYVLDVLGRLRDSLAELYFHPTLGPRLDRFGPNAGDLSALLSDRVRRALGPRRACNYLQLRQGGHR